VEHVVACEFVSGGRRVTGHLVSYDQGKAISASSARSSSDTAIPVPRDMVPGNEPISACGLLLLFGGSS